MRKSDPLSLLPDVVRAIYTIREQKVILDIDLAAIYGVETRALNQAIKRNRDRFPADFVFELRREEILGISQTVISLRKRRAWREPFGRI